MEEERGGGLPPPPWTKGQTPGVGVNNSDFFLLKTQTSAYTRKHEPPYLLRLYAIHPTQVVTGIPTPPLWHPPTHPQVLTGISTPPLWINPPTHTYTTIHWHVHSPIMAYPPPHTQVLTGIPTRPLWHTPPPPPGPRFERGKTLNLY